MNAYRSGEGTRWARGIACAACGKLAQIDAGDTQFTCAGCEREQPTEPIAKIEQITRVEPKSAGEYEELRPFAESVGSKSKSPSLAMIVDGLELEVSLSINSGTVCGIELAAIVPGLPLVEFRREESTERDAKKSGVTRELQTGDPLFDDAVFIDSAAADADILVLLSSPHVRAAIAELVESFGVVRLEEDKITVSGNGDVRARVYEPARIRSQLALLRLIAGASRPLVSTPVSAPSALAIFSMFNVPGAWICFALFGHVYGPFEHRMVWASFAIGLVIALAIQPYLARALSGRSRSHVDLRAVRYMSFISLPAMIGSLAFLCNGVGDPSAVRTRSLQVASASWDDESGATTTKATDGQVSLWSFAFPDPKRLVRIGQKITVQTKSGRLGFEWATSPATIDIGGATITER